MEMKNVINEILKFGVDVLEMGSPLSDTLKSSITIDFGIHLPLEYYELVTRMNGFSIMGDGVSGIDGGAVGESIEKLYYREHFEVVNPMPNYLIPFCNDGSGNHYCMNCQGLDEQSPTSKIVFWQWDYDYTGNNDVPDITHNSLADWIQEVCINWTLRDYDHDGNEK